MFLVAVVLGVAAAIYYVVGGHFWNAFVALPTWVLVTGVVGGSIREFRRARRHVT